MIQLSLSLQRSFRFLVDRFGQTVILSPADVEEIMNLNTIQAVCALGEVLSSSEDLFKTEAR